jgi:homoserine dehydrogenase
VLVEPLYDAASMGALSVDDFLAALPELDAAMQLRCDAAAARGQVLRYAATVDVAAATLTVGLVAVGAASPLGALAGSDNLVEVYSAAVYPASPLVVRGAGAGAASTAAGVLADMLDLA